MVVTMQETMSLQEKLHELRVKAGTPSLAKIAKGSGVSLTTVQTTFRGANTPTGPVLRKLVEHLGGDYADFRPYAKGSLPRWTPQPPLPPGPGLPEDVFDNWLEHAHATIGMLNEAQRLRFRRSLRDRLPDEQYVSSEWFMDRLGVSLPAVTKARRQGRMPPAATRFGHAYFWREDVAQAFVDGVLSARGSRR